MISRRRGHSDSVSLQQSKFAAGAGSFLFNFDVGILEAISKEALCFSWGFPKSKFGATSKGNFPIHVWRDVTIANVHYEELLAPAVAPARIFYLLCHGVAVL
jgi:hypothetical protein